MLSRSHKSLECRASVQWPGQRNIFTAYMLFVGFVTFLNHKLSALECTCASLFNGVFSNKFSCILASKHTCAHLELFCVYGTSNKWNFDQRRRKTYTHKSGPLLSFNVCLHWIRSTLQCRQWSKIEITKDQMTKFQCSPF